MSQIYRPYLVIPKLIQQPTWGGTYIAETKAWQTRPELSGKKIGQSYELYDKSNLSTATTSDDPSFIGELEDNKSVERQSTVPGSVKLTDLITEDPDGVLGSRITAAYGPVMPLLLKFTQALGNSFQIHIRDGETHPRWKPKPESWYYFEPGLITCGVRKGIDWDEYRDAVTRTDNEIRAIAAKVADGTLAYEQAKSQAQAVVKQYDPMRFVNLVRVERGQLLDLSPCGIHHSWEEDLASIPLGNVLYEIQLNRMDDESTIRSFDKGKMTPEGKVRPLQIDDYFAHIDRSPEANDPTTHLRTARAIEVSPVLKHERILETKYYSVDRLKFSGKSAHTLEANSFRHAFVRTGSVRIDTDGGSLTATAGHSAFIPAGCRRYTVTPVVTDTEILVSY